MTITIPGDGVHARLFEPAEQHAQIRDADFAGGADLVGQRHAGRMAYVAGRILDVHHEGVDLGAAGQIGERRDPPARPGRPRVDVDAADVVGSREDEGAPGVGRGGRVGLGGPARRSLGSVGVRPPGSEQDLGRRPARRRDSRFPRARRRRSRPRTPRPPDLPRRPSTPALSAGTGTARSCSCSEGSERSPAVHPAAIKIAVRRLGRTRIPQCSGNAARRGFRLRRRRAIFEFAHPTRVGAGAIAQLGERWLCKPEVTGSIPVGSTSASAGAGPFRR